MRQLKNNVVLLDAFLWLLVAVMAVVVAYWSVTPPTGAGSSISDKVVHYLAYTGLNMSMLLAAVWAPVRGEGRFPSSALAITAVAFVFGVAIEVVQGPLPERDADILDALANASGALTALVLWTFWRIGAHAARRS
jgi:VanZ family protein